MWPKIGTGKFYLDQWTKSTESLRIFRHRDLCEFELRSDACVHLHCARECMCVSVCVHGVCVCAKEKSVFVVMCVRAMCARVRTHVCVMCQCVCASPRVYVYVCVCVCVRAHLEARSRCTTLMFSRYFIPDATCVARYTQQP